MTLNKMLPMSVIGILLSLVKSCTATSETSAIIALSIFITIPALFLLTCCCSLIFVCHYRHKIPIFKSFWRNAKKGAGTGKAPTSGVPPPLAPGNPMPPPGYGTGQPAVHPPAAGNPSAPPGEKPPGSYEMSNPVEVDDVVVPIKK